MGWPKGALCLQGVFVKEIAFLLICFSYVQMASHPSLMMQQEIICLVVSLFAEEVPWLPFFSSSAIAFFFARQAHESVKTLWLLLTSLKQHSDNR